jgi:MFS family permease
MAALHASDAIDSSAARRTCEGRAYDREFWMAYVANALTMMAVSMLVRYADFVTLLGGAEGQLGLIVGTGMVGSLAMRMAQGVGIDRYGPRRIWLGSLALLVGSLLAHLWITSASGPGIFITRIIMQTSIAGVFGASITYISLRVPPQRVAEIVGTLGTSGFIGILLGPQLSDWICGSHLERTHLDRMFAVAALLAAGSLVAALVATRRASVPMPQRIPSVMGVLRKHHPGVILLVAIAVGGGFAVPNTFLRTFAAERGISQIGVFFSVYAVAAFVVRMLTRRLFTRYGNRPFVLLGLAAMATSVLLYLPVRGVWQLVLPGAVAGTAHALLFPALIAGGSLAFPDRYRGLATTLILAMLDTGNLIGSPLIGGLLHATRRFDLPAYPTMLVTVSLLLVTVGVVFFWVDRSRRPSAAGVTQPMALRDEEPPQDSAMPLIHGARVLDEEPVAVQPLANDR